jgi:hypothetical protein
MIAPIVSFCKEKIAPIVSFCKEKIAPDVAGIATSVAEIATHKSLKPAVFLGFVIRPLLIYKKGT